MVNRGPWSFVTEHKFKYKTTKTIQETRYFCLSPSFYHNRSFFYIKKCAKPFLDEKENVIKFKRKEQWLIKKNCRFNFFFFLIINM